MDIKSIIQRNNFTFNKRFGQNFISDTNLLSAIVADAEIEGGTVVEVGAGAGTLTRELAVRADKVVAYEIDRNLKGVLAETLADVSNVELIFADFMRADIAETERLAGGRYKVVANLPYYITTPVIMRFIEETENALSVTVMVQREVADRLTARPDTADYGAITAVIDCVGNARITRNVSRNMFFPVPNVDSAVVRIDIDRTKYNVDYDRYRKVVKASFAMRRKTLLNNLVNAFGMERRTAEDCLAELGVNPSVRGETLSTADFVRLTEILSPHLKGKKTE